MMGDIVVVLTFIRLILLISVHSDGQQRIHLWPNAPTYVFLLKSYTTLLDNLSCTAQLLICFWLLNYLHVHPKSLYMSIWRLETIENNLLP